MLAANFMDIKPLLELCCASVLRDDSPQATLLVLHDHQLGLI